MAFFFYFFVLFFFYFLLSFPFTDKISGLFFISYPKYRKSAHPFVHFAIAKPLAKIVSPRYNAGTTV